MRAYKQACIGIIRRILCFHFSRRHWNVKTYHHFDKKFGLIIQQNLKTLVSRRLSSGRQQQKDSTKRVALHTAHKKLTILLSSLLRTTAPYNPNVNKLCAVITYWTYCREILAILACTNIKLCCVPNLSCFSIFPFPYTHPLSNLSIGRIISKSLSLGSYGNSISSHISPPRISAIYFNIRHCFCSGIPKTEIDLREIKSLKDR